MGATGLGRFCLLPALGLVSVRSLDGRALAGNRSVGCSATSCEHPKPLWVRGPRVAVPLPSEMLGQRPRGPAGAQGIFRAVEASLTFASVTFSSPLAPDGPQVVVEKALIDTGSSDCEIRESYLRRLGLLPLVADSVVYETAVGSESYAVYEVLVTILGRTCAAAITVVPEDRFDPSAEEEMCSDEATIGHMALSALGLLVDPASRSLLHRPGPWPSQGAAAWSQAG